MQKPRIHILSLSFWIALAVFAVSVGYMYSAVLRSCDGLLIYGLDDPYIHLSIARTLAEHGVYGVHPGMPSFASSSVLWPWLLALFGMLFGGWNIIPLILNIAAGAASLWIVDALGRRHGLSMPGRLLVLMLFIVAAPMLPSIFNGMEHTLHMMSVLLLLFAYDGVVLKSGRSRNGMILLIAALVLAVLLRYETIGIAAGLVAVHLLKKEWRFSFAVLAAAALPICITGIAMLAADGYFLPNSVVLKSMVGNRSISELFSLLHRKFSMASTEPEMQFRPVLALLFVLISASGLRSEQIRAGLLSTLIVIAIALLLHIVNFWDGMMHRYSVYIVGPSVAVAGIALLAQFNQLPDRRNVRFESHAIITMLLAVGIVVYPLVLEGYRAMQRTDTASRNIYHQQYQAGRFFRRYYSDTPVAVNDIGLTVYKGGIMPVDLAGLATKRIAAIHFHGEYGMDSIRVITKAYGVKVAMVYDTWFMGRYALPDDWIRTGSWTIQNNVICGWHTVSFYATSRSDADSLRSRLRRFAPELPEGVESVLVEEVVQGADMSKL